MNNDKLMGIDHTLADINKQIKELYAKKAEIERKEREQAEVERKKREEEKEKELAAIKNAIKAFNEKHEEHYSLARYLPSDSAIEFIGEPIDKKFLDYLKNFQTILNFLS